MAFSWLKFFNIFQAVPSLLGSGGEEDRLDGAGEQVGGEGFEILQHAHPERVAWCGSWIRLQAVGCRVYSAGLRVRGGRIVLFKDRGSSRLHSEPGFGLRISGFGSRISVFGLEKGFEFRVQG